MAPRTQKQLAQLKEDRRLLILEAALKIFSQKGYKTTTMALIAKEAGISKGSIYNYYKNKEDLLTQIIDKGFSSFFDFLETEKLRNFNDEMLKKYIRKSMNDFKDNLEHWKIYFSLIIQPEITNILESKIMEMAMPLLNAITEYFTQKGKKNPYLEMRVLIATLDGIGLHYITDTENFPLDEATDFIIEKFIN